MDRARAASLPLIAFAACTLVWGSTWVVIKVGLEAVPPFTAAAARFAVAGVVLLGILAVRRQPLPRGGREWGLAAFVGVVLFGADYGLIYWAEQWLASGITSVLFAVMPLFTLLAAALAGLERVTPRKVAGILVGIAGVGVLFMDSVDAASTPLVPALAIIASAACASVATVAMKRDGGRMAGATLMAPAMLVGALVHVLVAAGVGEPLAVPTGALAWGSILYLALGGSVFTFLVYAWLLKRWDSSRASYITILTPVAALVLGAVLLDEPVTLRVLVGSLLVLAGVAAVSRRGRPESSTGAPGAVDAS